jgi:pSer/pThr/pTyr-binding forkhead associated (FHA) protein
MQAKNFYPRLQYATGNYTVCKPVTAIGRSSDNDLILQHDSVSRHHAKIVFTGNTFEIQDLGSTNKVIVNGQFVQQATLASGDVIGLGEIIIHFYS